MTKEYCDTCEKEIPQFRFIRIEHIDAYFCNTNCLTSNPRGKSHINKIYCSKECAKHGINLWIDERVKIK